MNPIGRAAEGLDYDRRLSLEEALRRLPTPEQWIVRLPGPGQRGLVFEDEGRAWQCARAGAGTADPVILTEPDGKQFYVFAASEYVEVSTRSVMGNVTRRVVDPS